MHARWPVVATLAVLIAACSDSSAPTAGGVILSVVTTGSSQDPDGYTISVDGGTGVAIGINAETTQDALAPGDHQIDLAGVATNCAVGGDNPRTVTVTAGDTVAVEFAVTCTTPTPHFAYVVNAYDPSAAVSVCAVNASTGALSACQGAGGTSVFNGVPIQGIVVNNEGTIAYLSNSAGDGVTPYVYQCQIDRATGVFSSCSSVTVTTPTGYTPYEGLLGINATNTMLYLSDFTGRVVVCPITGGNVSGSCTDTGATPTSRNVVGIAINSANTTAYIGNYSLPSGVNVCAVNGSALSGCVLKTGGSISGIPVSFQSPTGVAFNKTESIIYVTDFDGLTVYGCTPDTSSATTFSSCFVASSAVRAYNLALNAANTMAYITTYDDVVYECPMLSDGTFPTCTAFTVQGAATGFALLY